MRRLPILAFVLLFCSPAIWAHGTGVHVMGTVAEITADHLTIRVPNGSTVTVKVNAKTKYRTKKGTTPKPQVGDRVVIEAAKDGEALVGMDVQFNPPPPGSSPGK